MPVQLTEDRWERHIVDSHPDVKHCIEGIKETLRSPDQVWKDGRELLYIRLGACAGHSLLYLKVVVRDMDNAHQLRRGIVTAYLELAPPKKGKLLWMQMKN